MRISSRRWATGLFSLALLASTAIVFHATNVSAACAPSADFGSVVFSNNVSVPSTATYRVWSRIQIPNSTNNNYMIEIDGTCYTVGGNGSIAANQWTWVDYQSGGSKINVSLSQGTHTVKMFGTSDGVLLDRVLFTLVSGSSTCIPSASGNGDDCAVAVDNTAPTVNITAPTTGSTVSGTTTAVNATATDDSGTVSKVEFYVDGALKSTDTSSPFSYTWNTTTVTDGAHTLIAKAYDAANNVGTSSTINVTVKNTTTCTKLGDVNCDGATNGDDLITVLLNWKKSGMQRKDGDLNNNGLVNGDDLLEILINWKK